MGRNSQWEADNPNFPVIWPTDKCEESKWGRIIPGIQWAWSQTCTTSPCPLIGQNSQWEAENPNFLISWICQSPLIGQDSQWDAENPNFPISWIFQSPLIGQDSQWEADNPNFLVIWPTDKCEMSKWSRFFLALLLTKSANVRQNFARYPMSMVLTHLSHLTFHLQRAGSFQWLWPLIHLFVFQLLLLMMKLLC